MVMFDLAWMMSKDLNDMLWYVSLPLVIEARSLNPRQREAGFPRAVGLQYEAPVRWGGGRGVCLELEDTFNDKQPIVFVWKNGGWYYVCVL